MGLGEDEVQHGLTRRDMRGIYEELLGAPVDAVPVYAGGEVFAATGDATRRIEAELRPLWNVLMDRFHRGASKFNEEAQSLSFLYHKLGYASGTANPFIRRIWTSLFAYHTARPEDLDLAIWHLPAEKRYGIRRLFEEVLNPSSQFWAVPVGNLFRAYLGQRLGVPRRTPEKVLRDLAIAVPRRLQKLIRAS